MINIRANTFETNSSSTHSITICTEEEYNKFVNGELGIDWDDRLVPKEEAEYDFDTYGEGYEWYEEHYTSPSGDKIVAFGYYGNAY